jgi:putative hydrolase of the HAD superfamily
LCDREEWKTVRNVIFDLGGVVLEWNPDRVLENYYDDEDLRAAMKTALFLHPDWLQMDRGLLTEYDALARLKKRTQRPRPELIGLFEAIKSSLKPKVDTVGLLERLARRHTPLYCLSNMPESTFSYVRARHDFWKMFHGIVISGEVKMLKPERGIFEYLLDLYELSPAQTVFIDDHPQNILAAQTLGLHTVWFRDARQCEFELQRLLEDEPILDAADPGENPHQPHEGR